MNMKFEMEQDTMDHFGQDSATGSEDLGTLVRNFLTATDAAEGKLSGPQKARLDQFKVRLDDTLAALHRGSNVLVETASTLNLTLNDLVTEGESVYRSAEGSANFEGATTKLAGGGAA